MPLQDLHEVAETTTPTSVQVPASWPGLIIWAMGKWGVGVIFAAMLWPLYSDLKASNQQFVEVSKTTVIVLTTLSQKVEDFGKKTESNGIRQDAIAADLKRIEDLITRKQ